MVETDDGRQTMPGVWQKLRTGELKIYYCGMEQRAPNLYCKQQTNILVACKTNK